jgi:hypothetical protein
VKTTISLTCKDKHGRRAIIQAESKNGWIPFEKEHAGQMDDFVIYEICEVEQTSETVNQKFGGYYQSTIKKGKVREG